MGRMLLRIFTEPQQGADYGRLLAVARASEELGFAAFCRSDHYLKMGAVSGLPGPTDAWVTLAGPARETCRVRLRRPVGGPHLRDPRPRGPPRAAAAGAVRRAGGATGNHPRAVAAPARPDVLLPRCPLPADRLTGAAQA